MFNLLKVGQNILEIRYCALWTILVQTGILMFAFMVIMSAVSQGDDLITKMCMSKMSF